MRNTAQNLLTEGVEYNLLKVSQVKFTEGTKYNLLTEGTKVAPFLGKCGEWLSLPACVFFFFLKEEQTWYRLERKHKRHDCTFICEILQGHKRVWATYKAA